MILLLGGTSETAPMAEALANAGYSVLVSTATEILISVGHHPNIRHRRGRLSEPSMASLLLENSIQAIVDATHPYAAEVRSIAPRVAAQLGIEYLTFIRPGIGMPEGVLFVPTHQEAAKIVCYGGKPVLLTIGSKNLEPYAREALRSDSMLVVRVLPQPDSVEACCLAGISADRIVTGQGPFSIEDTRQLIRKFGIEVMVTKDSGAAGGLMEKLEAARIESCRVVIVSRPTPQPVRAFSDIKRLILELSKRIEPGIERTQHNAI